MCRGVGRGGVRRDGSGRDGARRAEWGIRTSLRKREMFCPPFPMMEPAACKDTTQGYMCCPPHSKPHRQFGGRGILASSTLHGCM